MYVSAGTCIFLCADMVPKSSRQVAEVREVGQLWRPPGFEGRLVRARAKNGECVSETCLTTESIAGRGDCRISSNCEISYCFN